MWPWFAPIAANRILAADLPRRGVCTAAVRRPGNEATAASPATTPADALTRSLRVSLSMTCSVVTLGARVERRDVVVKAIDVGDTRPGPQTCQASARCRSSAVRTTFYGPVLPSADDASPAFMHPFLILFIGMVVILG